jgi:fido (protein-threonine AMPylation protein)
MMKRLSSKSQMTVLAPNVQSQLTSGAIKAMVNGETFSSTGPSATKMELLAYPLDSLFTVLTYPLKVESQVTVQVEGTKPGNDSLTFEEEGNNFYIYDGEHHLKVKILLQSTTANDTNTAATRRVCDLLKKECVVIHVKSYVTSLANFNQDEPIVCITEMDICKQDNIYVPPGKGSILPHGTPFPMTPGCIPGGKFVDFLTNIAPFLSFLELSGGQENTSSTRTPHSLKASPVKYNTNDNGSSSKLELVSKFLSRHHAAKNRSLVPMQEEDETLASFPSVSCYLSALELFCKLQVILQKASITANGGRTAPTPITKQIIQQHQDVLQDVFDNKIPLTNSSSDIHINVLHYCHYKLCQSLIPDAGQFRNKTVRTGTTSFENYGNMEEVVSRLLLSLRNLCGRLAKYKNKHAVVEQAHVLEVITYSAAACMGILDTHPYSDGNGRLARTILNFVLFHELDLPFPVSLFATPAQRVECTYAICKTRQNISLLPVGDVPGTVLIRAYQHCGVLRPMVQLFLDRIAKSITEFNRQVMDGVNADSEEADLRTARNFRERSLNTGVCQICLDDPPNMSSLCCGAVYHIKC